MYTFGKSRAGGRGAKLGLPLPKDGYTISCWALAFGVPRSPDML